MKVLFGLIVIISNQNEIRRKKKREREGQYWEKKDMLNKYVIIQN